MLHLIKKIVKLLPENLRRRLPNEINLIKISKKESWRLNKIYLGKNRPTNVLSFYYNRDYGEILLCTEVIKKEAKEHRNSYKYQFTWMVLHGIIHLIGLHHELSHKSAIRVDKLEQAILQDLFFVQKATKHKDTKYKQNTRTRKAQNRKL